jgi:hypothetical protein
MRGALNERRSPVSSIIELHRLIGRQIWEAHVFQRGRHRPAASDVGQPVQIQHQRIDLVVITSIRKPEKFAFKIREPTRVFR